MNAKTQPVRPAEWQSSIENPSHGHIYLPLNVTYPMLLPVPSAALSELVDKANDAEARAAERAAAGTYSDDVWASRLRESARALRVEALAAYLASDEAPELTQREVNRLDALRSCDAPHPAALVAAVRAGATSWPLSEPELADQPAPVPAEPVDQDQPDREPDELDAEDQAAVLLAEACDDEADARRHRAAGNYQAAAVLLHRADQYRVDAAALITRTDTSTETWRTLGPDPDGVPEYGTADGTVRTYPDGYGWRLVDETRYNQLTIGAHVPAPRPSPTVARWLLAQHWIAGTDWTQPTLVPA